jgi:hypothetical protein
MGKGKGKFTHTHIQNPEKNWVQVYANYKKFKNLIQTIRILTLPFFNSLFQTFRLNNFKIYAMRVQVKHKQSGVFFYKIFWFI